jgi:hypothetical protein
MRLFQITLVFLFSLIAKQTAQAEQPIGTILPAAKVSVGSQIQKQEKKVLVREGELFQIYRPQNENEVKADAEKEAARQAEIEGEKSRLIELLAADQAKAGA